MESLAFFAEGWELPRHRSISEDELWKQLKNAPLRSPGEQFDAELEDEIPTFTSIPNGKPSDPPEPISRSDIKSGPDLSEEQELELFNLIINYAHVFSKGGHLGKVKGYKAMIPMVSLLPPVKPIWNAGPMKKEVIHQTIEQLLAWDVIEKSTSTTASLIVLMWQGNKWYFCVDFQQLNSITVRDAYSMLRSDYIFSTLAGKRYFSLLDTLKGYH